MEQPKTLIITNFGGPLTRRADGDINSGLAKFDTSWGYDPYSRPGNLTWMERPTSILSLAGATSIMGVLRTRVPSNSNIGYVYFVNSGGGGQLREVQVNDTVTSNPNYDRPSVMGFMPGNVGPVRSMGMVFYGSTQKIFYGDDQNYLQKINFDGSGGSVIALASSVTASVPRPMAVFIGKVYFGNGNNIGEIDSTELITTGAKLSPALPAGVVVKDLDVTPDGNYLQITASDSNPNGGFQEDLTATPSMSVDSYKFLWNGVDLGVTSYDKFGGIGLTASQSFGNTDFTVGYDPQGAAIYQGQQKIVSLPDNSSPNPTATFSVGNMLGLMTTEYTGGKLVGTLYNYGQYDFETGRGLFRMLRHESSVKSDVKFVNAATNVSNILYFPSYSTYANDLAGVGKMYFTTMEASADANGDTRSILWKFNTAPTGTGSVLAGVYETQTQLFSKRVNIKEVRLYTDPLVADNSFTIDLIGSGGSVLSGGSQIFTVGTNVTVGEDLVAYNPATKPTYAVGVRITNSSVLGTKNWTATKLELDYVQSGR